jgi:hypothetical protein
MSTEQLADPTTDDLDSIDAESLRERAGDPITPLEIPPAADNAGGGGEMDK